MESRTQSEEHAAAEIMHMFKYFYKDEWAPDNIFNGKTRIWIHVFNELVKQGFIERKKFPRGYKYKWKAQWPQGME